MEYAEQDYLYDLNYCHFVRVTPPVTQELLNVLNTTKCASVCVFNHHSPPASREHSHLLIRNFKQSKKTLRNLVKQYCPDSEVSIKAYDGNPDKIISYMSKGQYDPTYCMNYSPEYIQYCKELWVVPREEKSKIEIYWDEWNESSNKPAPIKYLDTDLDVWFNRKMTYGDVFSAALKFCITKHHGFVTFGARNLAKQLADTYAMRNNIEFK